MTCMEHLTPVVRLSLRLIKRSSLCDYNDAYILISGTITVAALAAGRGNNNMQVVISIYWLGKQNKQYTNR